MLTLPILALAVASFGIGTTEFVIMGLLPDVARSLGVTVPQAGLLVTGYALGVTIGAPIVALATARVPRKTALLVLMAIFLAGNVGCALAPTYTVLMVARVVTAFAHGSFFGIGAVVARDLVPKGKQAQAVSLIIAGLTLANMLGVPLGTALGQAAGWRMTFWAVAAIGVVAAAAIALYIPRGLKGSQGGIASEFRALRQWSVMLPMLVSTVTSISLFAVFTYVTPLLEQEAGLSPRAVTGALLLFGLGITIGNVVGGRLADRNLLGTVMGAITLTALVLVVFAFACHAPIPAVLTLAVWGTIAFSLAAPLQVWVVEAATAAPNLASILNQGAFNLGNALGAWFGGMALEAGLGYGHLPWLGAAISLVALGLASLAWRSGRPVGTLSEPAAAE